MTSVILPGSYDPVTLGHLAVIREAASRYDEVYVVVFVNPDKKYTFNEVCAKCGFNNSASLYRHLKKVKQANPRFQ